MATSASINTSMDPGFAGADLRRVAVFPIRNTKLPLNEAEQLIREISQTITKKKPFIEITSSEEAIRVLHERGLAREWARFLADYDASGTPNPGILMSIGQALGVDAIIQGEIVDIKQTDGVYGANKGSTRATVRYFLMGVESGKILWEASSIGVLTTVTPLEPAPPIIEAVQQAQQRILGILPF
jgi:hypothetical protein